MLAPSEDGYEQDGSQRQPPQTLWIACERRDGVYGEIGWGHREEAVSALTRIGPAVVPSLVTALASGSSMVRLGAVHVLGRIEDPRVVETLITALTDQDASVRGAVARTLGEIQDPRSVEPLIKALEDPIALSAVAGALGRIGDPRAIAALIRALAGPSALSVCEALEKIGGSAALTGALAHKDARARASAARTVGRSKDKGYIEPLITALTDQHERVRLEATFALGEIPDPRVAEPLIMALTDPDATVRAEAARALGSRRELRAVEPLIAALAGQDAHVRHKVGAALERIGRADETRRFVVVPLIAALTNQDEQVRASAADALGRIRDRHAIEPLTAALNPDKRASLTRVLKTISGVADSERAGRGWTCLARTTC